ncbi:alpha-1,3-glucosyltransferase [Wickerhamomyces ciferrii]|uniref:Alpha-1,3-glucosyltransferase n=1 Tax=Wickerhamomyces ciferrii (strain ATCC 14091 / BCRC 22168 / CBS 111 / JCM 3599 / NBRC 0793 / NRRL Y-1031 F-60-10) TaxID=1206466 RepID=K0KJ73_WICCF|nr:alpha-1,3-glucosyltransferase [Wickerhamomyces ciferrii]CCH43026.1 alpha-1,3-glucosyltransferase [Wickerhamomyces ciferrii]
MSQLKNRKSKGSQKSQIDSSSQLDPLNQNKLNDDSEFDKKSSKYKRNFSLWNIWVAATILKVLLFDTYHSTDFDVHRNWLAITNKLPIREWYLEKTSQWTLDYPPFFAYFEWFLSQFVPSIVQQDGCLDIVPKGVYGWPTVVFQRSTVIVSEILLFAILQTFINISDDKISSFIIASSLVLSPGLLIVDHIHFQYNGMMFGLLVGVIVAARHEKYYLLGALFASLLCFKHIFLYVAPAVFVYLLRNVVLDVSQKSIIKFIKWDKLIKLGSIVIIIFTLAFAPFAYYQVLPQLFERLFPFSRGLTHAYWAPNVWAIYSFLDKVLIVISKRPYFNNILTKTIGIPSIDIINEKILAAGNTGTKGLVQDVSFIILPNITPKVTFLLTLFYDILSLLPLLLQPNFKRFVGALTLNAYASFLFGWHVHEKAIMLIIIPFTFLINERRLLNSFLIIAGSGYVSLFPLLPNQNLIKQFYTLIWFIIYSLSFMEVSKQKTSQNRIFLFDRISLVYLSSLIPMVLMVFFIDQFKSQIPILSKFEFVGLMIYSVYCGIGVISSWFGLSWLYFFEDSIWEE